MDPFVVKFEDVGPDGQSVIRNKTVCMDRRQSRVARPPHREWFGRHNQWYFETTARSNIGRVCFLRTIKECDEEGIMTVGGMYFPFSMIELCLPVMSMQYPVEDIAWDVVGG